MTQPLTQRSFVKGLDASTTKFDQPRGSVPRISNMVFTRRGSLITVDGSTPLSTPSNAFNPTLNKGAIVAIQQYLTGESTSPGQGTSSGQQLVGTTSQNVTRTINDWDWVTTGLGGGLVELDPNQISNFLFIQGFKLNIPLGSVINGVTFLLNCEYDAFGTHGSIRDNAVFMVIGGAVAGTNHAAANLFPANSPGNIIYGGAGDTWGLLGGLTPTLLNSGMFGLAVAVTGEGNPVNDYAEAFINSATVVVTFTGGGGGVQQQIGQTIFYLQDPNPGTQLSEITGLVATPATVGGGTLTPGTTITYGVSVLDGEQNASAGVSVAVTLGVGQNAVNLTWNPVLGAGSYLIQSIAGVGPITTGSNQIGQVFQPDFNQTSAGIVGSPTVTFQDIGIPSPLINFPYGTIIWGTNSTIGPLRLYTTSVINYNTGSYNDPVLLAQFPCRANDALIPNIPPIDASGGVVGASGQVPQMIQFANLIIIALGNGFRPQSTDGTTVIPFSNTFTATYPTWAASTTYLVGDLVIPTISNGHYYRCTQGGQTQTPGPPTFSTTKGQITIDGQVTWVEAGLVTTSPAPRGGSHIAYHAGSLWLLNTQPVNSTDLQDGPSILAMSDTDNVKSFNPVNRAFIGKDDGSEGMGLASFTIAEFGIAPLGSLIAFKNFTSYQIVGVFGATDFNIQQLQTDMGCVAPRSIQYISGFGIIRYAHLGFALTDGVRDKLISEQIRPYIFGSPSTGSPGLTPITGIDLNHAYLIKSGQLTNPPMYVAAAPTLGNTKLTRLFLYDLVLKAWTIIDLPVTTNPSSYLASVYQVRTPGYNPVVVVGGSDNGSIQIVQNGAAQWNFSLLPQSIAWAVTTPEVFNQNDPSSNTYVSNLLIRGTNLDGNAIIVQLNINGEGYTQADPRVYNIGPGEFQIVIGVNETVASINAIIRGTGRVEIESSTWNIAQKPTGVPVVIS